jgi:hypothetical protein
MAILFDNSTMRTLVTTVSSPTDTGSVGEANGSNLLAPQRFLTREVVQTGGGVAVAHRAFHHWKRPAQRAVAIRSLCSPAQGNVPVSCYDALPAVPGTVGLRQEGVRPAVAARWWHDGRIFVITVWMWLIKGSVRDESRRTGRSNTRKAHGEATFSLH